MQFNGIRQYPDRLIPLQIGQCMAGFFFTSRNQINDLSYQNSDDIIGWVPPTRSQLERYCARMQDSYNIVDSVKMIDMFEGWPRNSVEEWAADYHQTIHLKYSVFYDAESLESIVSIKGFGIHSLDWIEYQELYQQATLMHKLKENL